MPTMPPNNPDAISLNKRIMALEREVRLLQERRHIEDIPHQRQRNVVFSIYGSIIAGAQSGAYRVKDFEGLIQRVDIDVDLLGTAVCEWQILVNDNVRYAETWDNDERSVSTEDLAIAVSEWDRISVKWIMLGETGTMPETCTMTLGLGVIEDSAYE